MFLLILTPLELLLAPLCPKPVLLMQSGNPAPKNIIHLAM